MLSHQDFLETARAWLDEHAAPRRVRSETHVSFGEGSDSVAVFHDLSPEQERQLLRDAMAWQAEKFAAGFGAITAPVEVGGRGLPRSFERAFSELEARYDVPAATETFRVTIGLVAPTIAQYGNDYLRREILPQLFNGERLVCQLFSEPDAGSDLASLTCRAQRRDDIWLINGQKVWTSGAQIAEYGELIARSDADAPKHRGMTAFVIPMDLPGIEIRPIRQMTGGASFNEVFFNDVEVPDTMRLGGEGEGWAVTLTTLGFEREVSGDHFAEVGGSWEQVRTLARHLGVERDSIIRQRLTDLFIRYEILRLHNERVASLARAEHGPGVLGSISKLMWTENMRAMSDVASSLLGARLVADTGEWGTYSWGEHVLGAPGYRIAGGSDEIQRSIIGERVLGLPKEPSPSK